MKCNFKIVIVHFIFLMTGCAVTQNPIYKKADLVEPPNILGVWKDAGEKNSDKIIRISKSKSAYKTFRVIQEDTYTIYYYNCRFVQFGSAYFADIETADSNFESSQTGHLILKAAVKNDTLKLYTFHKLSAKNKISTNSKIKDELNLHFIPMNKKAKEEFMFNEVIITDSTERLKQILTQHSNDSDVIVTKPIMILIRKS